MLDLEDLVSLRRVIHDSREDLDSLTSHQNKLHRNFAHVRHTTSIDDGIQLGHKGQNQIAVLNTVTSNPRTT